MSRGKFDLLVEYLKKLPVQEFGFKKNFRLQFSHKEFFHTFDI